MYVEGGLLQFHYNGFGDTVDVAPVELAPGRHRVVLEYEALGERRGRGRVIVGDRAPGNWVDMSPTLAFGPFEGLDIGLDRRAPVSWRVRERHRTFPYRGTIDAVRFEPGPRAPA